MADDDYIMGELARSDLYPDESQMQPPANAPGGLTPEDWMLSGQQPPQATYDYVPPQSWLQKAGDLARRDVATYQQGGVPAMMGQLAEDSSGEQDLAGGFGGNIKGVGGKLGAIADLAPHAPPFYSAVEQAVQGAKQTTAPGQQWRGFLSNQPGVKPEEINTLKLGDLFDQTGAVTKQDLLDHIAANKVQLGEVVKGSPDYDLTSGLETERALVRTQLNEARSQIARGQGPGEREGRVERVRELADRDRALTDQIISAQGQPTKFSQYTLPGGENYREMLLTLPKKQVDIGPPPELLTELPKGPDWENSYRVLHYGGDGPDRAFGVIPPGQSHARAMAGQHPTEAEAVRQALNHINAQNAQQYNQALYDANKSGGFTSSHFDEPNILAHIRTNDRVIDGKKTLFVEEVQSDWHQKGKREGYAQEPATEHYAVNRQSGNISPSFRTRAELDEYVANLPESVRNNLRLESTITTAKRGVPDAPFKTTWPDLAMKRVIREAAEKGYDKVAWTPGSVQADRYDLSKQLRELQYLKNEDGTYQIAGTTTKGEGFNHPDNVSADKLPDVVGKEMAQKIVNNEGKRARGHPSNGGYFDGVDLKVGGEGMKGFYDQILPATVNKLVKKHGARVTQSEIPTEVQKPTAYRDYEEYADMRRKEKEGMLPKRMVHTLDITPQLREMALKKGFPLFTAGGIAATGMMGDLAKQDEYQ